MVLPVVLAGLTVFLAIGLVDEARLLGRADAIESGVIAGIGLGDPDELATDPGSSPFAPPAFARFGEVLARPVFSPTRRPPVQSAAEPVAEAAALAEVPDLRLHGIVAVGTARVALLGAGNAVAPSRVAPGDEIGSWRVEQIGSDKVVLRRGTQTHLLQLAFGRNAP
jgi:hypothetical protein